MKLYGHFIACKTHFVYRTMYIGVVAIKPRLYCHGSFDAVIYLSMTHVVEYATDITMHVVHRKKKIQNS